MAYTGSVPHRRVRPFRYSGLRQGARRRRRGSPGRGFRLNHPPHRPSFACAVLARDRVVPTATPRVRARCEVPTQPTSTTRMPRGQTKLAGHRPHLANCAAVRLSSGCARYPHEYVIDSPSTGGRSHCRRRSGGLPLLRPETCRAGVRDQFSPPHSAARWRANDSKAAAPLLSGPSWSRYRCTPGPRATDLTNCSRTSLRAGPPPFDITGHVGAGEAEFVGGPQRAPRPAVVELDCPLCVRPGPTSVPTLIDWNLCPRPHEPRATTIRQLSQSDLRPKSALVGGVTHHVASVRLPTSGDTDTPDSLGRLTDSHGG